MGVWFVRRTEATVETCYGEGVPDSDPDARACSIHASSTSTHTSRSWVVAARKAYLRMGCDMALEKVRLKSVPREPFVTTVSALMAAELRSLWGLLYRRKVLSEQRAKFLLCQRKVDFDCECSSPSTSTSKLDTSAIGLQKQQTECSNFQTSKMRHRRFAAIAGLTSEVSSCR